MLFDTGSRGEAAVPEPDIRAEPAHTGGMAIRTIEYSRFVRLAKIVLPGTAAGLFLAVVLYSALNSVPSDLKITVEELKRLGGELEMSNPTLTYTDDENRAFVVNADRAKNQSNSRDLWALSGIRGRMTPPEGQGYKLTSDTGLLDASKKLLDLKGQVLVVSDGGYTFEAHSAHVDMNDNRVTSEEPVKAHGGTTTITSDRFEMWDKGARLRFEGNVRFLSESAPRTVPPDEAEEVPGEAGSGTNAP